MKLMQNFGDIKQKVKRKAVGLLGIIGLTTDDLAAWKLKQETKK